MRFIAWKTCDDRQAAPVFVGLQDRLDKDLKIVAYEASFYQNAGRRMRLTPPVLERTPLSTAQNSYFISPSKTVIRRQDGLLARPPQTLLGTDRISTVCAVKERAFQNGRRQVACAPHLIKACFVRDIFKSCRADLVIRRIRVPLAGHPHASMREAHIHRPLVSWVATAQTAAQAFA